jgi:hypothetical protein
VADDRPDVLDGKDRTALAALRGAAALLARNPYQAATGYETGHAGCGMGKISAAIAGALHQQPDHLSLEEALYILTDTISGMRSVLDNVPCRAAADPEQVNEHAARAAARLHEQVTALLTVVEGAQTFALRHESEERWDTAGRACRPA